MNLINTAAQQFRRARRLKWVRRVLACASSFGLGVSVVAQPLKPVVPIAARPLPLSAVRLTGDPRDYFAAAFFWDAVVQHHSFATGGHGKDEYFGPPDQLSDRVDGRTAESCNVYNLLKLTRGLFALRPDVDYAGFEERALFNHVLASMDPTDGRMCYMVPVGRGV